jgi:hypothetical protein
VFQCSGGIVERKELSLAYSKLQSEGKSEKEIMLAFEESLKAAGLSNERFDKYNSCIVALNTMQQKHKSTISVVMAKVDNDSKSRILSSETIASDEGEAFSSERLKQIAKWVSKQLPQRKARVITVNIPEKLKNGMTVSRLFSNLDDLHPDFYVWKAGVADKVRTRVGESSQSLSGFPYPLNIEVVVPGFHSLLYTLDGEHGVKETVELVPKSFLIGVEKFGGKELGISEKLSYALLEERSDFEVKDSGTLQILREELEKKKETLARSPMIQMSIRETLGLDFVISGSVTTLLDR